MHRRKIADDCPSLGVFGLSGVLELHQEEPEDRRYAEREHNVGNPGRAVALDESPGFSLKSLEALKLLMGLVVDFQTYGKARCVHGHSDAKITTALLDREEQKENSRSARGNGSCAVSSELGR
jgi:hypothetical protein